MKKQTEKNLKKNLRKWITNVFLLLLLLLGIALIFNEQIKDFLVQITDAKYAVANVSKEQLKKNNSRKVSFDVNAVQPMSTESVVKSQLNRENLPVIASVAVPSVSINLPIFKGVDNASLLYGAGTLFPDQKMGKGNYALASHRASNPNLLFTPLENLKLGAKIYLTDLEDVYTYKAFYKEKVSPSDTQLLNTVKNSKIVTLITCGDMEGRTRLVVQGIMEKVTPMKKATNEMRKAFNLPTRTF
jgi:sortase A